MTNKPVHKMTAKEMWGNFTVELVPYQTVWMDYYREEEATLTRLLGGLAGKLCHIGSTAVPGMAAKPIIDILLEVESPKALDKVLPLLTGAGYIPLDRPDHPGPHLSLVKGYTPQGFLEKTYHIHVRFPGQHDEIYFRDFLRKHPEVASGYAKLKRKLAEEYRHDRDGYTAAKTDFVMEVMESIKKTPEWLYKVL